MRVITGSAKGRKLITVEGTELVRPTTDRVKEAIFSAIQFEIEGRKVLDLFAGSGQLGIEAMSRGAKECWFVDNAARSISAVRQNVGHTVRRVFEVHKREVRHSAFRPAVFAQANPESPPAPCRKDERRGRYTLRTRARLPVALSGRRMENRPSVKPRYNGSNHLQKN